MKRSLVFILIILFIFDAFAKPKGTGKVNLDNTVFIVDVIRHGLRTPELKVPNLNWPVNWITIGPGSLLPGGIKQEVELGKQIRDLYIKSNYIPESYELAIAEKINFRSQLKVFASNSSRTILSAEALLQGIYPSEFKINSLLPIYTYSSGIADCNSNKIAGFLKEQYNTELSKNSPDNLVTLKDKSGLLNQCIIGYNQKLYPRLEHWSNITGLKFYLIQGGLGVIANFSKIYSLSDNINSYHGALLDYELNKLGFSNSDIRNILNTSGVCWAAAFNNTFVANVFGAKTLKMIYQSAGKSIIQLENNNRTKYVVYVTHDAVISSIMKLLGYPLRTNPHFASYIRMIFVKNTDNSISIKIYYSNQIGKLNYIGDIPFNTFKELVNNVNCISCQKVQRPYRALLEH